MTKKEFMTMIELAASRNGTEWKKFRTCSASITNVHTAIGNCEVLKSYNTIVAVYVYSTDTLYVYDFYSRTTCQHVYKFEDFMSAGKVVYLYKRTDRVIFRGVTTDKLNAKEFRAVEAIDFACFF